MSIEIRVPTLGESVSEATIAKWLKKAGDAVAADEPVVELETDKVSLEVPAPSAGILAEILIEAGTDVAVGTLIGRIDAGAKAAVAAVKVEAKEQALGEGSGPPAPVSAPAREIERAEAAGDGAAQAGPAARKLAAEKGIDLGTVPATGPKGKRHQGRRGGPPWPTRRSPPPRRFRRRPPPRPPSLRRLGRRAARSGSR